MQHEGYDVYTYGVFSYTQVSRNTYQKPSQADPVIQVIRTTLTVAALSSFELDFCYQRSNIPWLHLKFFDFIRT